MGEHMNDPTVVVGGKGVPTDADVKGIITKEHVADSVADSIKSYA